MSPANLNAVRFQPEAQLIDSLFRRYGLEDIVQHYVVSGRASSMRTMMLATQLRLTAMLSPRLCSLFDQCRAAIGFSSEVELYVVNDASINAFALHAASDSEPHIISLTSGAVERMTDKELSFVLGHELGHIAFDHYRANQVNFALDGEGEDRQMPALLAARMHTWDRLAELSADRVGFLAAGESLEPIVSVFFKLASGLGPEHLQFDISAFLDQLQLIQDSGPSNLLAHFSHPVTPVRVRALQLYAEAGGSELQTATLHELDTKVSALAQLMEHEVSDPGAIYARDFLVAGGLLAGKAEGLGLSSAQQEMLVRWLLDWTSDPESLLARVTSIEQAEDMLTKAGAWLSENSGEERYKLFSAIAHLCAVDGQINDIEKGFLMSLADYLGIPESAANEKLFEAVRIYLDERAARERPEFL
ncbi:MAG: hypothetical protein CMP23_14930 [Rickettsiales bacterium]|nr:hypothetical protein [Rickettsiales bacterium]|tara:strand:+ start:1366 stop:2619 length:1254 start_codon:yes stop_codon:yes gene_type:complete